MNRTKLSNEALKDIRANAGRGGVEYKVLAKKYGVHVMTINYWANEGLKEKSLAAKRRYAEKHRETTRVKARERNQRLKLEVLSRYSSSPSCDCCGESSLAFLSIDHIGGGGAKHRKEIGNGKIYGWLKKNNYAPGFRVLCMNCNHAYGHYPTCPHKDDKSSR